jgi:tetratricopeptide (TPR) repeat protein
VLLVVVCLSFALRTIVRNRDWQDGERLYRSAVHIVPDNAKAYILLGGALRGKGQYAAALDAYGTALKLNPEYPRKDAHFNAELGGILFKLGRVTEALAAFEQAVTLDPKWGRARIELGFAHANLGNFDKAEAVLRHAISLTPESPDLYFSLSLILNEQGRYQDALVAADATLQRDPTHPWGLVNRAIALEGLKRPEEAKAVYEQALTSSPRPESMAALDEARQRLEEMRVRQAAPPCTPGLVCK